MWEPKSSRQPVNYYFRWIKQHYRCTCWLGLIPYRPCQAKRCLRTCVECADWDHPAHVQSIIRAFALIHYVVSSASFSGQWRPWSDCADAQADLGLRCPHMPEYVRPIYSSPMADTYCSMAHTGWHDPKDHIYIKWRWSQIWCSDSRFLTVRTNLITVWSLGIRRVYF